MNSKESILRQIFHPVVIVGALGYFVDVYDLILFSTVRTPSLKGLGFSGESLTGYGSLLLNVQMAGMLVGGIFFGILGDRLGRVTLLFGSILLYSIANIANGFVHTIETYALWRFIAGFGLAGELGGGITLVTEVLPKELRGYGTAIVSSVGVFGAVIGALVAQKVEWRTAYFIGGVLGLFLLVLRMSVAESGMFRQLRAASTHISRGNILMLFTNVTRFMKYLRCILVGLPLWCVIGVLVTFSPEISQALGIRGEEVSAARAVMFAYLGITFGGYGSGHFSQLLRSRKKVLLAFLFFTTAAVAAYFCCHGLSSTTFYLVVLLLGFGVGYWTIFVTVAAEQFGTNIRATVATTVPNFVRGATVPLVWSFNHLKPHTGAAISAAIVSFTCLAVAIWAVFGMEETHGKDLDYIETT